MKIKILDSGGLKSSFMTSVPYFFPALGGHKINNIVRSDSKLFI